MVFRLVLVSKVMQDGPFDCNQRTFWEYVADLISSIYSDLVATLWFEQESR